MTTRKYSSRSQQTTLTASLGAADTTALVVSGSALLGGVSVSAGQTYTVVIDPDTALEEIVDVTAVPATNTLTITRGVETGGTGQAHSAGAVVRHMAIGRDFREANEHIENTTTAHGLTIANVLETTDTNMITTAMLQASAVTTAKIADSNVTTAKIADSAITSAKIADLGIATGDIADAAITGVKILDGAVGTAKIDNLAVTEAKIGTSAVTTGKIADLNVTTGKIADSAITSAKIADGTIVNADISAVAAIDKTKISGTAITAADTGTVTSTMIADGTIANADISSSAQIAYSKLNQTNSIVDADINASAAIAWSKIAPSSTVSATELGYLDGVTSAVQTQLDSKLGTSTAASTYAPLASPALTGVPTAPTATAGTNTTQVATTAFVGTAVSNLVASAPAALDTLNELAASLGNDANFATTVTNNLATKLPLAGGTMSGAIAMGTNKITGLGTPTASTDAATKNYVDTVTIAPSNLTGPITSVGSATSVASQTGTGSTFVMNTSPTLVTPALGVATATSINGTTIPTSKTLVATDSTAYVVPSQTGNAGTFLTTDGTTSSWTNSANNLNVTSSTLPTNGVYLPAANTLGLATNSTERIRIDSSGQVGIGVTPTAGRTLEVRKSLTGGTSASAVFAGGTIQSDVTSQANMFTTFPATQAAAFALTNLVHYNTAVSSIGAGSSIGTQIGFNVGNLTQASTNIAFKGATASAANAWNFYADGTAANYFAGRVGIGATLTSGAMAQVVNTTAADIGFIIKGAASQTGDLLQIQNSAATVLATVTSAGNVGIGTSSPKTKLHTTGASSASMPVLGTASGSLYVTNIDTNYGLLAGVSSSSGAVWLQAQRTDANATAYDILLNPSGGKLGYGSVTAPAGAIHARYDAGVADGYTGKYIFQTTDQRLTLKTYWQSGVGQWAAIDSSTDTGAAQALAFQTGGTERMRIDGSGNTTINSIADATTSTGAVGAGYMGLPQVQVTSGGRTLVAGDAGKHIYMTTTSGQTITIPANSSVAFPVGTTITIVNANGISTSIAITTDALRLAGTTSTGTRTLASNGVCTLIKIASTEWISSGNGLS